ncbi:aldo/keto reductase [Ruegeria sp. 2205SS24-7]|uniref:aldo/keto reductase n=1 Tax=Ruegeria discodermiae TaxID=3064389 RepID=UPI002741105A|nr:aldo/keto reductase [Ruegeria sp. 2205SS24-7]MDP5218100.1 aldo/keto reductase [Ruegeria sp. 2205SS24-7]
MTLFEPNTTLMGMGCWPIGGAMFNGDTSLGYSRSDDGEAIQAIHAALDAGIHLFDTAAAYGAGHADRLLAQALRGRSEAMIVSKIGLRIDEASKQVSEADADPNHVIPAIERCLDRLDRDCIDILLLHVNDMEVALAEPLFDQMEQARAAGKIRGYGWSTDFTASAEAMAGRAGFVAVEHAMNVFLDAPRMSAALDRHGLTPLIRSPLAMGLLGGGYGADSLLPGDDVRAGDQNWISYFSEGRPNPEFLTRLDAVRELLQSGGRSLAQGALCWLWGRSPACIPLPGARNAAQITDSAGALRHGPLPPAVMDEIDALMPRNPEAEDRAR